MPSIENRIVQMQFDNTSFERRLGDTLKSLDHLNQTIANAGSKNGLANLEQSVRGFNLGPVVTSIEGVSSKFLAMATIGVTALSTIVTKALEVGGRLLKSLSLQPLIDGFQEYGNQIGSIQTILANTDAKGTTLTEVNDALNQLNEYSDKTIYNFGQMTRNIGTFTAAGVDLDTSVQSIKGIANLAAISGSTSEQASSAMYQLSQAIATGSVKLMDWNSIVNAGMGGEVFQKALFETGKQMKTITDVPMNQTFEEWTDAGNSFRGSLETGWLTADVLTKTLSTFTGELSKEQLVAMGFTEQQAAEFERLGQLGVEAATKVRTLKGLIDTTKEALGSGWAQSFRIIFGDFNEATELFTNISNNLGAFIKQSAEARNALLQGWADLGGRTLLIEALSTAFHNLGEILAPIKEAFREVFPPLTAQRLMDLTTSFKNFADALKPSEQTVENLKRIFTGFFGALEIGWTVIKETARFIADLFTSATGAGSGKFLEFAAKIGDFFANLNDKLVTQGGIRKFFEELPAKIAPVVDKFNEVKDAVVSFLERFAEKAGPVIEIVQGLVDKFRDFFSSLGGGAMDVASDAADRLNQRFQTLRDIGEKLGDLWGPFKDALNKVADILDQVWDVIKNWFAELGAKLDAVLGPGDFDKVVDAVNVGLLGAIAGILAKFLKSGFKFDLGDGLFSGITKSFGELTGVLKAMQTDIKADALLKIASAVGILTASVLVLSLIDSAALTKGLSAMAVGFAQLVGAFALLNTLASGPRSAASLAIIATGLILLSTAMLILSGAVAILATMDWEDLGKGMAGIIAMLGALIIATKLLQGSSIGMIASGAGLILIATSLNILAGAVKLFATMDWGDMLKGFVGIGVGLGLIALAVNFMPPTMPLIGAGLILVAASLSIIAASIMLFAKMDWGQMGKGMVGLGGGLLIIAGAMQLMPVTMPLIGAGLLLVSASLLVIAKALKQFGGMDWGEIGKGLAAMGGSLLILAAGAYAMSGSLMGAVAIGVMAVSLTLLVKVIKELAAIKIGDLIKALVGLAAVFAVLGVAALVLSPITPMLLGLGAALILVGAGFALFGAGAALIATAFEKIAAVGSEGLGVVAEAIDLLISKLPALVQAFAVGLVQLATVILEAAPPLVAALGVVIEHLISTIITLLPKIGELIGGIIQTIIDILRAKIPEYIQLGIDIILALLTGIRDNIAQVVTLALEVIGQFLQGLAAGIPQLIDAAVNVITTFINAIASQLGEIVEAGVGLIVSFIDGITNNIHRIVDAVGRLIAEFIRSVANLYGDIIDAGFKALLKFLDGITNNLVEVVNAVGDMIARFISAVGNKAGEIAAAGLDALIDFLGGVSRNMYLVTIAATAMIIQFIQTVAAMGVAIAQAGANAIIFFLAGISASVLHVVRAAFEILINFVNGLASAVNYYSPQLRQAGINLAFAIIDGATWGLASKAKGLADKAVGVFQSAVGAVGSFLGIGSPSKLFQEVGGLMMEGAAIGISKNTSMEDAAMESIENMTGTVRDALNKFTANLNDMGEMNPVITPVLDLSQIQRDAQGIGSILGDSSLAVGMSNAQAQTIAASPNPNQTDVTAETSGTGEIRFEQNIYAPEQLSTGEIYRQTRTQLTMAKEELSIP